MSSLLVGGTKTAFMENEINSLGDSSSLVGESKTVFMAGEVNSLGDIFGPLAGAQSEEGSLNQVDGSDGEKSEIKN